MFKNIPCIDFKITSDIVVLYRIQSKSMGHSKSQIFIEEYLKIKKVFLNDANKIEKIFLRRLIKQVEQHGLYDDFINKCFPVYCTDIVIKVKMLTRFFANKVSFYVDYTSKNISEAQKHYTSIKTISDNFYKN